MVLFFPNDDFSGGTQASAGAPDWRSSDEATYTVLPKLDLTAGVRYFDSHQDFGLYFSGVFGTSPRGVLAHLARTCRSPRTARTATSGAESPAIAASPTTRRTTTRWCSSRSRRQRLSLRRRQSARAAQHLRALPAADRPGTQAPISLRPGQALELFARREVEHAQPARAAQPDGLLHRLAGRADDEGSAVLVLLH